MIDSYVFVRNVTEIVSNVLVSGRIFLLFCSKLFYIHK